MCTNQFCLHSIGQSEKLKHNNIHLEVHRSTLHIFEAVSSMLRAARSRWTKPFLER